MKTRITETGRIVPVYPEPWVEPTPPRSEFAKVLRRIFRPGATVFVLCVDYASTELKVLADLGLEAAPGDAHDIFERMGRIR